MKHLFKTTAVAAALGVAAISNQALADQALVPAQSAVNFEAKQMGVPLKGHFKKFDAKIAFDAAKPEASKIHFSIDTGSATMGAKETDAELPKADWFNVAKFPQATFDSSAVKALGGGKFQVDGTLTVKGNAQKVSLPVTLTQSGATTTATGTLPLKRLTFKIGDGDWKDTSMVADEVTVQFKLALTGFGKI
ncbi:MULTISPECIES: YceI family protein [Comamonas]|uniref:YceI family protein n=1 Tax=Comamonas suwonensis TaxID=2606214 RepID=A0A843B5I0_9BURK|nr:MULTISPECIES: YceI family protein [Comamonas]MBI1626041.1 YceI family protein [Comamonas suwonensis]PIG08047.1 polyisoprenoid-binding protein YceI [Comamonas sp. 26]